MATSTWSTHTDPIIRIFGMDLLNTTSNKETAAFIRPGNRNNSLKKDYTHFLLYIRLSAKAEKVLKCNWKVSAFFNIGGFIGKFLYKVFQQFYVQWSFEATTKKPGVYITFTEALNGIKVTMVPLP